MSVQVEEHLLLVLLWLLHQGPRLLKKKRKTNGVGLEV
jgi:hypothetical protein